MSVRRFDFDDHGNWIAHSYGDYCVYDDALKEFQSSLAEREQRISELESLLKVCVDNLSEYVWRDRDCEEWCEPQYLAEARAALAATEGEKQ